MTALAEPLCDRRGRFHANPAFQCLVNRAPVRNAHQSQPLLIVESSNQFDLPLDARDPDIAVLTLLAIGLV